MAVNDLLLLVAILAVCRLVQGNHQDVMGQDLDSNATREAVESQIDYLTRKMNKNDENYELIRSQMDYIIRKTDKTNTETELMKEYFLKKMDYLEKSVMFGMQELQTQIQKLEAANNKLSNDFMNINVMQNSFVGFTAYPTVDRNYNTGDIIQFDATVTNYGDHYDPTYSIFTCPATGYYWFNVNVKTDTNLFISVRLESINIVSLYVHVNSGYGSNSVITLCDQGQRVDVICTEDDSHLVGGSNARTTFSAALLQLVIE